MLWRSAKHSRRARRHEHESDDHRPRGRGTALAAFMADQEEMNPDSVYRTTMGAAPESRTSKSPRGLNTINPDGSQERSVHPSTCVLRVDFLQSCDLQLRQTAISLSPLAK